MVVEKQQKTTIHTLEKNKQCVPIIQKCSLFIQFYISESFKMAKINAKS